MTPPSIARWVRSLVPFRLALAIPLLSLPAIMPLFTDGAPGTPDALVHFVRMGLLDDSFRHGVFFPRWLPGAMLGHGYPVFDFYAPASYYVAEVLRLCGLSHYLALLGAYIVFILLAGLGMYLLAEDVFGPGRSWPALAASAAYMYAPYFLTNVYVRGAYAEAAAMAVLPWIFWGARRLMRSEIPAPYALITALSLGLLALTHNVTLVFLPPALVVFMALQWKLAGGGATKAKWAILAVALAMGISAFFWLPLLAEQPYIVDRLSEVASSSQLANQAWRWHTFLDRTFVFDYSKVEPYQLGLAQAGLAIAGIALARRRDAEWLFFGLLAVTTGVLMGAWALPLWYGNRLLLVAQFPWRLLSIMSVPLALLTGGVLLRLPRPAWQAAAGLSLLVLIVVTNRPQMKEWGALALGSTTLTPAIVAQVELLEPSVRGASGLQEFTPRWAQDPLELAPESVDWAAQVDLSLLRSNSYGVEASASSLRGGPLRFSSYYFPGWRVVLDDRDELPTYPTTNLGLLTVDLPPGEHLVSVRWDGTPIQHVGSFISVLAFALCGRLALHRVRSRWALALVLPVVALAVLAADSREPWQPVQRPTHAVEAAGMRLLGLRTEQDALGNLVIHPTWHITDAVRADMQTRWLLQDRVGNNVSEVVSWPYFNTTRAGNWPAGTVQADAYQIALPSNLAADEYRLSLQFGATPEELGRPPIMVGTIALAPPNPPEQGAYRSTDTVFGPGYRLAGFRQQGAVPRTDARPAVVKAGGRLSYTLFWQNLAPNASAPVKSVLQLTDAKQSSVVELEQWPGPLFSPSMQWSATEPQPDLYQLKIPRNLGSGLYWPWVSVRVPPNREYLLAHDASGLERDNYYALPPIKVIGRASDPPTRPLNVRMDQLAVLMGFDLPVPPSGLLPGANITVTLHYRVTSRTDRDYTRFVHLSGAGQDMIAQNDGLPMEGANPTWSWEPGEEIADPVPLRISGSARPGTYTVEVGFYDMKKDLTRLPLYAADGALIPNASLMLLELKVR
jgi:hypothetical protein